MNKKEFLFELNSKLERYGIVNRRKYLEDYSKYLDNLIENGFSEDEVVAEVGTPNEVLLKILSSNEVKVSNIKNKVRTFLLLLGIPVWGPVIFAILIIFLALVLSVLICSLAFDVAGIWLFFGSFIVFAKNGLLSFVFQFGSSCIAGGLGIIFGELFILSAEKISTIVKSTIHTFLLKEE